MPKIIYIAIFSVFFLPGVVAQQEMSPEEIYKDAEFFFDTEEYEEALYLFRQLAKDYPRNNNLQFRVGMSYLNIPGKETQAVPFFKEAVQRTTLKYKEGDFDQLAAPHHAWFYLGKAYRINNQLDEALEAYEKFMDIRNFDRKYNLRITENEIESCQRAKIIKDSPIMLAKKNLGQTINSTSHNFHPVLTPDEQVMIYMQRLKFYDAIMYTYKDSGEWVSPVNITPQVGSDGDMIPTGISADGTELLLVKEIAYDNQDIYYSKLEGNFWSTAVPISKKLNTIKNESHASFSTDGKWILIASDRRGSYGKLDIFKSERLDNGEWGDPENLGPVINSEEDENSAYFMNDDKQLYFSSKGHFNMGGYDIFFSELENDEWTDPVNIGYPLNTTGDNNFYYPVREGNTGYMALFDDTNLNEEDIYRIEIAPVSKIPVSQTSQNNKNYSLQIIDPETGEVITISYNRETDGFEIKSNNEKQYKLKVIQE